MKKDWVMLFIAVMFASVMWPMAAYFSYSAWQQAQTASWPAADEAEVMSSRVVTRSRRRSGNTYRPEVKYRYRVGDRWHIDERISFSTGISTSGGSYAQTVVSAHPAGAKATVYVDPADWTRSVLKKGMNDRDWQSLSLVAALIVIPVVVAGVYIGGVVRGGKGYVGTVRVFEPAPGVSVYRDIAFGPWAVGLGTLTGGAIATVIVVMGFVDTNTREVMLACWGGSVVLAVIAGLARRYWINRGRKDGVIDLNAGTLSLARGRKREPEVIDMARVTRTSLIQDSSSSTNKRPHWRVHLWVEGLEGTRPIADIRLKADARDFENWVRERLALEKEPVISRKRRKRKEAESAEDETD